MFQTKSSEKFYARFTCEDDCRQYLYDLKWKSGFACSKCGHSGCWKGRTAFHKRCAACGYDESCTTNTLFHKTKFSLLKAFRMIFQITSPKTGKSTVDLAKDFGVIQPTAWLFKNKVQAVMQNDDPGNSSHSEEPQLFPLDSIILMHRGDNQNGLQRIDLELGKRKGACETKSTIVAKGKLPEPEGLEICRLVRGKFTELRTNMLLWNFKRWLTGTHHHCSFKHLNGYLNEFFFKLSYRNEPERMWHAILARSLKRKPEGML